MSIPLSRRDALRADLALVVVTAIWGSTFIVNRRILDSTPPLLFLVLRFGIASVILILLARGRRWSAGLVKDGAIVGSLLAFGIGVQLVGQLFTTASKAAFVSGLSVPLTPVVGYLVSRKVPSPQNLFGLAFATVGFTAMCWPTGASGVNVGDLLILGTAVSYAYIIVHIAEVAERHDVRWFSAGQTLFAAVFVAVGRLVVTPFLGRTEAFFAAEARPLPLTRELLIAVVWMSLVATVVTFLVQTWAQARMSATHAAILFALEPVFTALFAAIALGERMSAREWAGAALVLVGIVVAELPSGRK